MWLGNNMVVDNKVVGMADMVVDMADMVVDNKDNNYNSYFGLNPTRKVQK